MSTARSEFLAGARDTIPLIVGAIPFGIIFGVSAAASGLSSAGVLGMSVFVFAGSSQFIAVNLLKNGASIGLIVLTTFVVNVRHALYSATLAPHVKHLSQRWLIPLAFWLTDETFAVTIAHYNKADESPFKHWYYLGSAVAMYSNWQICTLIGLIAGNVIPDAGRLGLDFAMVVTFIGIVVPNVRSRPMLIAVSVAAISAVATYGLPNKLGLIVTALLGIIAGMVAESVFASAKPPIVEVSADVPV